MGVRAVRTRGRTGTSRNWWDLGLAGSVLVGGTGLFVYGVRVEQPLLTSFSIVGVLTGTANLWFWLTQPARMRWWFEHMNAMLGGCIGGTTAFLMQLASRIADDTLLVWLAPTVIGVPLIAIWDAYYRRQFGTRSRRAVTAVASGAIALLLAAPPAAAQTPAPAFDVVSIKRNASGTTQQSVNVQPTGVTFINFQMRAIVQLAYGIPQPARLIGLPDWINDRYDVIARTSAPVSPATIVAMRPMLQAMFADRLELSAKVEKREMPAYALVLSRRDGRPGPNLKRSSVVCAGRAAPPAPAAGAPAAATPAPVPCGPRPGGPGRFLFVGSPLSVFAGVLSLGVGRTVVDRTGLTGLYDFEMSFAPEAGPGAASSEHPSLFTALQEQLGLKLDPEREVVDVLIADSIQRPTEN
jgi:uncharacterized protein (TIGR03435 family)